MGGACLQTLTACRQRFELTPSVRSIVMYLLVSLREHSDTVILLRRSSVVSRLSMKDCCPPSHSSSMLYSVEPTPTR